MFAARKRATAVKRLVANQTLRTRANPDATGCHTFLVSVRHRRNSGNSETRYTRRRTLNDFLENLHTKFA